MRGRAGAGNGGGVMRPNSKLAKLLLRCLPAAFFLLPPAGVHAATVAEIANLNGPDREQILVEGAKKEGKVILYSAMIEDQALRPVMQAFRQKYPFVEPE